MEECFILDDKEVYLLPDCLIWKEKMAFLEVTIKEPTISQH